MVTFSIFGFLWRFLLIVVGAFLLYCIVSYPFQRRWLTARLRVDEWLKGQFFRSGKSTPPGFAPVGEAARPLARSLDKLVKNYRNTSNAKAMKGLREDAREIVISIVESVTEIFEHWKILAGMDLIQDELESRAQLDAGNLETLYHNLEAFRGSFQKAAVSQNSEALAEASRKVNEVSHFARLMSESLDENSND